jgi:hypothetical protein
MCYWFKTKNGAINRQHDLRKPIYFLVRMENRLKKGRGYKDAYVSDTRARSSDCSVWEQRDNYFHLLNSRLGQTNTEIYVPGIKPQLSRSQQHLYLTFPQKADSS